MASRDISTPIADGSEYGCCTDGSRTKHDTTPNFPSTFTVSACCLILSSKEKAGPWFGQISIYKLEGISPTLGNPDEEHGLLGMKVLLNQRSRILSSLGVHLKVTVSPTLAVILAGEPVTVGAVA